MRLLLFALCLSALGAGSYWALTSGWATPGPGGRTDGQAKVEILDPAPAPTGATRPLHPTPSGRAEVRTHRTTTTYAVDGATADQVLASLAAQAPRTDGEIYFGLTSADIGLRYDRSPQPGGCVLTGVQVDLKVTVTLPDWTPSAGSEPSLAHDWRRFRRALAGHEDRHRQIAEDGAHRIVRALDGLRRASCADVETEARRRLQRVEIEITAAQRRYDSETGHGRTEGAVWPLGR